MEINSVPVTTGRWRYVGVFVICLVATVLLQFLGGALAYPFVKPSIHPLQFNALARPLALAFMIVAFGIMARLMDKQPGSMFEVQGLGLRGNGLQGNWPRNLLTGLFIGALVIVFAVLAIMGFGSYTPVFAPDYKHLAIIVWIGLTAGALEEVACRGYPFATLSKAIGGWPAALFLSVLFGSAHLFNPHHSWLGFTNTVLVGLVLAYMVMRTGSLWMAIGFHFAWNFTLGTLFGLPVSGVDLFVAIVRAKAEGHPLLTGGDYGIEASLTGTAAILLGMLGVHLLTTKNSVPTETSPAD
jgi:uncharacterized protein